MATNRAAPRSQGPDVRPISFLLEDAASGAESTEAVSLYVRPQDLTRQDPSRLNVNQTLGGAWGDSFGPGVPIITISGHTGWRRGSDNQDGEGRFMDLRDKVYDQWHERRASAVRAGRDPADVHLVYADALDNMAVVVAPLAFQLRRSRSQPLLFQYQIQMAVLGEAGATSFQLGGASSPSVTKTLGLESLAASINKITSYVNRAKEFVDRQFVAPMQAFMRQTAAVYQAVYSGIKSVDGLASSVIDVARLTAQAGSNICRTFAAVAGLPSHIKGLLIDVGSAYTNIFCVLSRSLKQRVLYEDYADLYGASNCSSTSGGRPLSPLAGVNAFSVTNPAPVAPLVGVTPAAQAAMATMARSDVALAPLPPSEAARNAAAIAAGVQLA